MEENYIESQFSNHDWPYFGVQATYRPVSYTAGPIPGGQVTGAFIDVRYFGQEVIGVIHLGQNVTFLRFWPWLLNSSRIRAKLLEKNVKPR